MGEKRVTQQVASDEIYNDDWFLKDSVLHDTTKVQPSVIKEYVNRGMATATALENEVTARQNMYSQLVSGIGKQMSNLADFYVTTKSYVVGDVVMQQSGELLRCIAPTSGEFDNTKWEQVTVDELFDDLNFSADAISYDNETSGLEADDVQDAIDETITKLSAVGTASGDIATFPDGSDLSMPKLEVAIEPVQEGSGDPSPENIRPIIGWDEVNVGVSGVNIWDEEWEVGSITDSGAYVATQTIRSKNLNSIKPNTNYKIVQKDGGTPMRVCFYDKDKTFISRTTNVVSDFTTPSNCYYFKLTSTVAYGATYNNDISVNYPSTDTSYHAYNGHTYTIDLDGTRYGGKVDLVSGVMTVTHISINLNNTNDWQLYNGGNNDMYYLDGVCNDISISEESLAHVICSKYPYSNEAFVRDAFRINTGKRLYVGDTRFVNDLSGFKESLTNGLQLVYELATPITIQLTPTVVKSLRGKNNVFADSGAILDAEYIRDLTAIIDYILEQLGN